MQRLIKGLGTMETTTEQVAKLQEKLEIKMVEVDAEKKSTNELIEIVSKETEIAENEQQIANVQEEETIALTNQANETKAAADGELKEALPAMERAKEAVACLDKKSI